MPSGDRADAYGVDQSEAVSALSAAQRADLTRVVQRAHGICGLAFGVYVGPLPEGRASAVERHAALPTASSAVLVAVDPAARAIEIVTGADVGTVLDDRACELAAITMKSCFMAGDLVGGVREGVTLLAEHARAPRVLHLDDPA